MKRPTPGRRKQVREGNPLKQGLKLKPLSKEGKSYLVREGNPLKQGLKHTGNITGTSSVSSQRRESTKTRIETNGKTNKRNDNSEGQRRESTKTRIETGLAVLFN